MQTRRQCRDERARWCLESYRPLECHLRHFFFRSAESSICCAARRHEQNAVEIFQIALMVSPQSLSLTARVRSRHVPKRKCVYADYRKSSTYQAAELWTCYAARQYKQNAVGIVKIAVMVSPKWRKAHSARVPGSAGTLIWGKCRFFKGLLCEDQPSDRRRVSASGWPKASGWGRSRCDARSVGKKMVPRACAHPGVSLERHKKIARKQAKSA